MLEEPMGFRRLIVISFSLMHVDRFESDEGMHQALQLS